MLQGVMLLLLFLPAQASMRNRSSSGAEAPQKKSSHDNQWKRRERVLSRWFNFKGLGNFFRTPGKISHEDYISDHNRNKEFTKDIIDDKNFKKKHGFERKTCPVCDTILIPNVRHLEKNCFSLDLKDRHNKKNQKKIQNYVNGIEDRKEAAKRKKTVQENQAWRDQESAPWGHRKACSSKKGSRSGKS